MSDRRVRPQFGKRERRRRGWAPRGVTPGTRRTKIAKKRRLVPQKLSLRFLSSADIQRPLRSQILYALVTVSYAA